MRVCGHRAAGMASDGAHRPMSVIEQLSSSSAFFVAEDVADVDLLFTRGLLAQEMIREHSAADQVAECVEQRIDLSSRYWLAAPHGYSGCRRVKTYQSSVNSS